MTLRLLALPILLALLCVGVPALRADEGQQPEYRVKAAYLYNFAKFVDWPSSSFPSQASPFTVCVIGRNPFGNELDQLVGRSVRQRRLAVRHIGRVEEAGACQILFVSGSERGELTRILGAARARGVLTVSDMGNFAASGGMIGLITREDRVHFNINLRAIRQAGLKISAQVLKLATSVIE